MQQHQELVSFFEHHSKQIDVFNRGEFIYHQGDCARKVYLVKHGNVSIGTLTDRDREIIKSVASANDFFGFSVVYEGKGRSNFAKALNNVVAQSVPEKLFADHLRYNCELCLEVITNLCQKLHRSRKRLDQWQTLESRARVVESLKHFAEIAGSRKGNEIRISNLFTHEDLANFSGLSRQTATMTLLQLRNEKQLHYAGSLFVIKNLNTLK